MNGKTKKPARAALCAVLALLVCLCAPALTAYAADAETEYTVRAGDTLWSIAVRYRVGLSELRAANPGIGDGRLIYPGQTVAVPAEDPEARACEAEVIRLVNEIRARSGLSPLEEDWQLSRVARYKSDNMRELRYFSHTSPTYGSPYDMMRAFGLSYRTAGENIAMGYRTPRAVVDAWMNSSGHRANILNANYKRIGVGYVSDGSYCTQMFIG